MVVPASHRGLRAAIAATTAVCVVLCGLLALQHEASVAHVRDGRTGEEMHALAVDCHDQAPAEHLHGLPESHDDTGVCRLIGAIHQSTRTSHVPAITAAPQLVVQISAPRLAVRATPHLLLAAPKTSPPAIG